MKFINFAKYRDLDRIATARPAHFEYADRLRAQGKLATGGPLMDDQGRRIALLFISREEAMSHLKQDPFAVEGVFADCEFLEWLIEGLNPDLLTIAT